MNAPGTESKPSPISGQGLFATRAFAAGEKLAAYHGTMLSLIHISEPTRPY